MGYPVPVDAPDPRGNQIKFRDADLNAGDFVFMLPKKEAVSTVALHPPRGNIWQGKRFRGNARQPGRRSIFLNTI